MAVNSIGNQANAQQVYQQNPIKNTNQAQTPPSNPTTQSPNQPKDTVTISNAAKAAHHAHGGGHKG